MSTYLVAMIVADFVQVPADYEAKWKFNVYARPSAENQTRWVIHCGRFPFHSFGGDLHLTLFAQLRQWDRTQDSDFLRRVFRHRVPTAQAGHDRHSGFLSRCHGKLGSHYLQVHSNIFKKKNVNVLTWISFVEKQLCCTTRKSLPSETNSASLPLWLMNWPISGLATSVTLVICSIWRWKKVSFQAHQKSSIWERNVRPQIDENWTRLHLLLSSLWPNEFQQMLITSKLNKKLTRCSDLFSDDGLVVGPVAERRLRLVRRVSGCQSRKMALC